MKNNLALPSVKNATSEIPSATSYGLRKRSRDIKYESDNSCGIMVNINSDSDEETVP